MQDHAGHQRALGEPARRDGQIHGLGGGGGRQDEGPGPGRSHVIGITDGVHDERHEAADRVGHDARQVSYRRQIDDGAGAEATSSGAGRGGRVLEERGARATFDHRNRIRSAERGGLARVGRRGRLGALHQTPQPLEALAHTDTPS